MYWAVIGDLIRSRRIADRAALQVRIEQLLAALNRRHAGDLASLWTITIGDEFQGLALHPRPLPEMVQFLAEELHPHGVRFGIGHGAVTTPLKPVAVGMDGPAFHAARLALRQAREGRQRVVVAVPGQVLPLPTCVWDLALKVALACTSAQREAVRLYRALGRQGDVAARLGVSQGTVSVRLQRALHAEVEAVLAHLPGLLAQTTGAAAP